MRTDMDELGDPAIMRAYRLLLLHVVGRIVLCRAAYTVSISCTH